MTAPRITAVRDGVDLVVDGGPERDTIGERLVAELDDVSARGLAMLRTFLADTFAEGRGEFDLLSVQVGDDISLTFAWLPSDDDDDEAGEWENTYFDVGYLAPDPRREDTFRPVRFEIGFW